MNKGNIYDVILATLLLSSAVESLLCLQGLRVVQNGIEISNTLATRQCADSSHICHRIDAIATQIGTRG